jgi:eukaryotic-like serine/threonine-protein kinase
MDNKIGRFEILSELAVGEKTSIYKATDPESNQTVALKALKLELFGEQAAAIVQRLQEEIESAKALNSPNIAALYGAGEMEGQFVASLEYIQGNSVETTLRRNEGFSIWDIQDITRQVCQALDHAQGHKVAHSSLEPSKIMAGWDGTVKLLGYGISKMGAYAAEATGAPPATLHYMSPEQLDGKTLDTRSNLFTLGAILYEMATDHKPFSGDDADQVRQQIREHMPPAPIEMKAKIHPVLSELIMKTLAKDPDARYQSGRELVLDLERCKDSPQKAKDAKKAEEKAQGLVMPPKKVQAPAANPFIAKTAESEVKPNETAPAIAKETSPQPAEVSAKAVAAAVGGSSVDARPHTLLVNKITPKIDPQGISSAPPNQITQPQAKMSAAVAEPEVKAPKISVDPAMAESKAGATPSKSFSDISELPPMKTVIIAPEPVAPVSFAPEPDAAHAAVFNKSAPPEKPKVQPKELAMKAAAEIKKTPPKLFMYSIAGALAIIILAVVWITFRIHSENSDDDGNTAPAVATRPASPVAAAPVAAAPVATNTNTQAQAPAIAPPAPETAQVAPEAVTPEPQVSVTPRYAKKKLKSAPQAPVAAVVIPGQLTINSTPQGAQVQIDGHADPSWVTPYNMAGVGPGSHTIIVSKSGYGSESRSIDVASGSKSFVSVQLASLLASISISSDPVGASILMDGHDTGKVTPSQISVDKAGSHSFVLRKQGYLDDTSTENLQSGQTSHYSPSLHALGSTDDIKIGGKLKKMFGGSGDAAGMGLVSIKTTPKNAQVAVNNRIIDKNSPVDFSLNPGTYVIDVTLSGYNGIHRVVNVDKGGKVAIDEVLQRQ